MKRFTTRDVERLLTKEGFLNQEQFKGDRYVRDERFFHDLKVYCHNRFLAIDHTTVRVGTETKQRFVPMAVYSRQDSIDYLTKLIEDENPKYDRYRGKWKSYRKVLEQL